MQEQPTNLMERIRLAESQATTRRQRDLRGNPLLRFQRLLEVDTTEVSTVTLRYVRIVVLNFLLLTTANAIGERATSVSLTLAMPRGAWLQIGHYRRDLSKSPSQAAPPLVKLPQGMWLDNSNPRVWEVREVRKRPWWRYLTQG